jgi:hypothetical protein
MQDRKGNHMIGLCRTSLEVKRGQGGRLLKRVQSKIKWRRLETSPANRHDSPKLELSRAWEPSDSSRPLPNGKGEEA